jgi:hypothetical protein
MCSDNTDSLLAKPPSTLSHIPAPSSTESEPEKSEPFYTVGESEFECDVTDWNTFYDFEHNRHNNGIHPDCQLIFELTLNDPIDVRKIPTNAPYSSVAYSIRSILHYLYMMGWVRATGPEGIFIGIPDIDDDDESDDYDECGDCTEQMICGPCREDLDQSGHYNNVVWHPHRRVWDFPTGSALRWN